MKIIVGGAITNWHLDRHCAFDNRMAYVLGLQRLGHEIYLFADIEPHKCLDSNYNPVSFAEWEGRQRFETLAKFYGIWPHCCLIYDHGTATHGMSFSEAVGAAKTSHLLFNITQRLKTPEILQSIPYRAYIDLDPGKTQVYHAEYGIDQGLDRHEHFFTVGTNIGTSKCGIPTCGLTWHGIFPPVLLTHWPVKISGEHARFTSISSWWGERTFDFNGRYSGEKADNWLKFLELPTKTTQELELVLTIDPTREADIELFTANGWRLLDPRQLHNISDYKKYIANSRAEFSIANNCYVEFNTGWFSDRSARYLASGKPVLVQSTGIEDHLPTGKGLLTFTTMEEAIAGIEAINKDYLAHCRAARQIAEEYFDSDRVLPRMLRQMGFRA
jgi:hypothetical protein